MRTRPAVAVLALGGTIAMTSDRPGGDVAPGLSADELVAAVPGLDRVDVTVVARTVLSVPGASLTFADLGELAALIDRLADEVDGVVLTQGTDTIEETAFALDLTVRADLPVVVTGAMRNPTLAGADGPANLLAAIQVAACPGVRGYGTLVVLSDEIHAARRVRKTHSTSVSAFVSPDTGPLGHVVAGAPRLLARPAARVVLPVGAGEPVVALVTAALGDDFPLLRPVRTDLDGLVVAGFGVGHVPAGTVDLLAEYAARVPVVLAGRTGAGAVHEATYGFPGSELDLQRRGLLNAGFLDPYKARVLLRALLAAGLDRDELAARFREVSG